MIAALWDATDASTEQLMDKFYDELNRGAPPDAALRAAKLYLLHQQRIPQSLLLGALSTLRTVGLKSRSVKFSRGLRVFGSAQEIQ